MNKLSQILTILILTPLVFTGCATQPSIEEQVKLVQYEKCLSYIEMIQSFNVSLAIEKRELDDDASDNLEFKTSLEDCREYLP